MKYCRLHGQKAVFIVSIWLVIRKLSDPVPWTQVFNAMGLILLIFPLYQFTAHAIRMKQVQSAPTALSHIPYGLTPPAGPLPDIYYIVLDAYPRQDVLERRVGYDNTPFLDELRSLGFYVADCSQSNYAHTELSLASTLNFNYLEDLGINPPTDSMDRYPLIPLVLHSQVRQILASMGYDMVAFESGHPWTEVTDAEYFFSSANHPISNNQSLTNLNGLELMVLDNSLGIVFTDALSHFSKDVANLNVSTDVNRPRVLYTLDMMRSVPLGVPSPKFVFAHIVSPHFPVVFGPNGENVLITMDVDDETYAKAYQGQITYLNKRVLEIIHNILTVSAIPPIIIIQGDHGYDLFLEEERTFNLSALYLPNKHYDQLYPQITSVNTFRVVFNAYFDGKFELLDDRAYYSTYNLLYDFTLIPNRCDK